MKFKRHFTEQNQDPFSYVEWKNESSVIKGVDGTVISNIENIEVPKDFNKNSTDVMASKYFRATWVPFETVPVDEKNVRGEDVPEWLRRSVPTKEAQELYDKYEQLKKGIEILGSKKEFDSAKKAEENLKSTKEKAKAHFGAETSAKQAFRRLAGFWTYWGWMRGYFDVEEDARIFYEETIFMLSTQRVAPNTPQWFNSGIYWAYGLAGNAKGFWKVDPKTGEAYETPNFFETPGLHACFPAGTPVLTKYGFENIESIKKGDKVITHEGRVKKVIATMSRKSDTFVTLNASYCNDVSMTEDHPVYVVRSEHAPRGRTSLKDTAKFEWVKAKDLKIGDYAVLQCDRTINDIESINISDVLDQSDTDIGYIIEDGYIRPGYLSEDRENSIPNSIKIDDDFMELCGWFLAEGDTSYDYAIRFSLGNHEKSEGSRINELMEKVFSISSEPKEHNSTDSYSMRFYSKIVRECMVVMFGKNCNHKRIPNWIMQLPTDKQSAMMKSLMDGDGCFHKGAMKFGVANKGLRDDLWNLFMRQNISGSRIIREYKEESQKNWENCHILSVPLSRCKNLVESDAKDNPNFVFEGRILSRVNEISTTKSTEQDVFNIEVEDDNSYIVDGITVHNCHITGVADSLFGPSGIYENLTVETRAFATGGGCGKNISNIRSKYENLANGNAAVGSMAFALIDDRSAGVVKSGSSQRRAAKMVIMDIDDPEVPDFIEWKEKEEKKVDALVAHGYSREYEGEAYKTVSGQNSNNSIRISKEFLDAVENDKDWNMVSRTTGDVVRTMKARELWDKIGHATAASGDPGVQFEDIINDWNTCSNDGRIRATNPCSEYIFLDNTSCNLASVNLQKYFGQNDLGFKLNDFNYTCQHWLVVLDISIEAAHLPSKNLAEGTYAYRTTGLGHTGIGAVLMRAGVPYGNEKACATVAAVTSLMTANTYIASGRIAETMGSFPRWEANQSSMIEVLEKHRRASKKISDKLETPANKQWDKALKYASKKGYRNAFTTVIQPSGTVGILMGCDTTSIEPDFSIVKLKKLSGGGFMKMVNSSLETALKTLKYEQRDIDNMLTYVLGHNTLHDAPYLNYKNLKEMGATEEDLNKIEAKLGSYGQLKDAIAPWNFSSESEDAMGLSADVENIAKELGFSKEQYLEATKWICGHGTFEGSGLDQEDLAIFDCANPSGFGKRSLSFDKHTAMMGAVSPFISGGISKTVNMPKGTTADQIKDVYLDSYKRGIKCIAVYVDGCKKSQPLNNPSDMSWWDEAEVPEEVYYRGQRKQPPTRGGMLKQTVKIYAKDGEHKVIIKFGEYADGSLCEIWIDVSKSNPDYYIAMKWAARAISNAIQYGQPLKEIAESFMLEEGGPGGITNHPHIKQCTSVIDLVMKIAIMEYEGELSHCSPKPKLHNLRSHKQLTSFNFNGNNGNGRSILLGLDRATNVGVKSRNGTAEKGCPRCGAGPDFIDPYPCPTCTNCNLGIGGCSL